MRWDGQQVESAADDVLPGLARLSGFVRSVRTPEFAGVTFHEVLAKSALNKVPTASQMPFRWTVNPYRGCSHACVYCFARNTHTYLDFDAGDDFDRQVVVKTNVADVLRREVARRGWSREHVALGTNTDPYQRAEGRYQLMPGIIEALAGSGTPFSILTKGTLARRDLPLLQEAARQVDVSMAVSLALLDPELHRSVEPGTPSPRARLDLIRAIRDAGLPCGVLIAPVLPWLTDSTEHLEALVAAVAEAGATGVTFIPLHLRPGAREWFMQWLGDAHPQLVVRYRRLYRTGSYLPGEYREWLRRRTEPMLREHDFEGRGTSHRGAESPSVAPGPGADLIRSPTLF